ncbi:MAG: PilN domain-containing protein [Candidatus Omnitrophota bacterium]
MFKLHLNKLKLKKPIVVVEIGNDWLKVLENEAFGLSRHITKAKFIKLAQIKESVPDAISKIFRDLKLNKQSVITYIPRNLATVRILELPSTDPGEISDMVNLQIGKQTPYTKKEIVSSHKILDIEREGYTRIILAIARRAIISERIEILKKAGIEVEKVALSSEGAYNWFNSAYMPGLKLENGSTGSPSLESSRAQSRDSQAIVLVDIDSNYSDFIVINKKKFVFTRSILIGMDHFHEEPNEWQDKFVEDLKRSIELYQTRERNIKIVKIFLSGAGKNIKDLSCTLSSGLDMPVEVTDPLKGVRIKKDANILREDSFTSISISPLIGVAIKHKELTLDLTPEEVRIQKFMEEKRKQLTVMGILFASIVMMASLLLLTNICNKNAYLEQLKQKIAGIKNESMEVEKMRLRIDLVERRLDAKGASINILNEIFKLTPDQVYLTGINIKEKKEAILKGRASAMSDVFKFITILEDSPYFENVKTAYATTKKEKNTEYATFEIMCVYEKE